MVGEEVICLPERLRRKMRTCACDKGKEREEECELNENWHQMLRGA